MTESFADRFRSSPYASLIDRQQVLTAHGGALEHGEFGVKHSIQGHGAFLRHRNLDSPRTHQAVVEQAGDAASRYERWPLLVDAGEREVARAQASARNAFALDSSFPKGRVPLNLYKMPVRLPRAQWSDIAVSNAQPGWSSFWRMYTRQVSDARRADSSNVLGMTRRLFPFTHRHPGTYAPGALAQPAAVAARYLNDSCGGRAEVYGVEGFTAKMRTPNIRPRIRSRSILVPVSVGGAFVSSAARRVALLRQRLPGRLCV